MQMHCTGFSFLQNLLVKKTTMWYDTTVLYLL